MAMTDSSLEQLPLTTEDDPSVTPASSSSTLRYPQLLLETSFASLLTHSYTSEPASSTNMEAPQRDPTSLSESWASISDAELSLEEDLQSEHTDLGSLIDIHSTGDVQSIRDDDTSSEVEPDDQDEQAEAQQAPDSVLLDPVKTPMNASQVGPNVLDGKITLDEPSLHEPTIATKTVRHFSTDDLRKAKLILGVDIVAKVHMPIGKESIKDGGQSTFQMLLFCQEAESEYKDDILHKVADAQLVSGSRPRRHSSSSPSKYHVIPDTFGPGSQPSAATMIPVDYQLDSTHYATASFEPPSSGTILLGGPAIPQGTVSKWTQNRANPPGAFVISGSQLGNPDLAIVVVGDLREAKNRDFARASLAFARRHKVPSIAVGVQGDLVADPALAGFITDGLHLTLQYASRSHDAIVRTLPIDFHMFCNLDASQLSRHIRHLRQRRLSSPGLRPLSAQASEKEDLDIEKNLEYEYTMRELVEKSTGLQVSLGRWVRVLILALCGMIALQGLSAVKMRYNSKPGLTNSSIPSEAIVASIESLNQLSSSTRIQVAPVSKALAVATGRPPAPSADNPSPAPKKFEVEIVGDSNLVIRTAQEYQNAGSSVVFVARDGRSLQADVRMLFPSVWHVRLEPEQAYGEVSVRMLTRRPAMNETVAVDMGPQPSSAWNLKNILDDTEAKFVQKFALLQESLEYLQPQQRPQNIVKDAQARVAWMMQQVESAVQAQGWHERASAMQETVQRHTKAYAQSVDMQASRLRNQLEELRHLEVATRERLPRQLETFVQRMRASFNDMDLRDRVQNMWGKVQEGPHSDTLAMAQERAQHVVKDLRERSRKR